MASGSGETQAVTVEFTLNGRPVSVEVAASERLLDTLRGAMRLPGTKEGCGEGECGACTPGVVMTTMWIRDHPELLETHTLRALMAGNLCRCTGYDGIIEGVEAALKVGGSA